MVPVHILPETPHAGKQPALDTPCGPAAAHAHEAQEQRAVTATPIQTPEPAAHSPGPYQTRPQNDFVIAIDGPGLRGLADVYDITDHGERLPDGVWEQNARLFASAPDLLAACIGPEPELTRLGWLRTLLNALGDQPVGVVADLLAGGDDDSYLTMLAEVRTLHDDLRAAIARATEGQR